MNISEKNPIIDELGGKNGILNMAQDNELLSSSIVPLEILKYGENLSPKQKQSLLNKAEKYQTNLFIIRTSHKNDWKGLVDVMPSKVIDSIDSADEMIEIIQNQLSMYNKSFGENSGYNASECSISIAPYLGADMTTLTEHPNTAEKSIYIDDKVGEYQHSRDYYGKDGMEILKHRERHNAFNDLKNLFREQLGFSPDAALQFEMGWDEINNKPVFFQVRHFADRAINQLYDTTKLHENREKFRWFGTTYVETTEEEKKDMRADGFETNKDYYLYNETIRNLLITQTPQTQLEEQITHVRILPGIGSNNLPHWTDFEKEHPDAPHILYNNSLASRPDSLNFLPKNSQGYIGRNLALGHNHTKYIQKILTKPRGSAILHSSLIPDPNISMAISNQLMRNNEKTSDIGIAPLKDLISFGGKYLSELDNSK